MTSFADNDLMVLDKLNASLLKWVDIQFKEIVNSTIGLREHIINVDLPSLRRIRWYAMYDDVHAGEIWQRYIENEELEGELRDSVFDFYISGSTYLWINNPVVQSHYSSFIDHLALNLSWMNRCRLVPEHIREHSSEMATFKEFLLNNHWVVFLILLSMADVE